MSAVIRAVAALMPRRDDYAGLRRSWRTDLLAGLTVAVVALPLALGFGISSGLTAEAGLITAIVAGLVAAVFGGSAVQVSGPTGAMAVVLLPIVASHGAGSVALVGLMAGVIITAAAFLRLGRVLDYIPWPVIEGFTLGIAIIIFLQQVPSALGVERPEGENTAWVAIQAAADAGLGAAPELLIVALVAVIMVGSAFLHRALPGALLAVAVATVVAEAGGMDIEVIGALPGSLPAPSLPSASMGQIGDLMGAAIAVAALAAIESLLSAKVADGMRDGAPHDPDRELFGQGLANLAAPMFGGMPATGAIARTAVNVRSGAHSRVSSITHALVLLAVVLALSGVVGRIPLAALAGVLMVTAVRMVDRHGILSIVRATRSDALVLGVTAAATVAFDLVIAIEVGIAVAAVLALRALARTSSVERTPIEEVAHEGDGDRDLELMRDHILIYRLDGALFFGAAQRFLAALRAIDDVRVVILRLPAVRMLDATGAQALGLIVEELEARGITVLLKGPRPEHMRALQAVGVIDRLRHEHHLFHDLDAAVAHARTHVARETAGAVA